MNNNIYSSLIYEAHVTGIFFEESGIKFSLRQNNKHFSLIMNGVKQIVGTFIREDNIFEELLVGDSSVAANLYEDALNDLFAQLPESHRRHQMLLTKELISKCELKIIQMKSIYGLEFVALAENFTLMEVDA